MVSKVLLKAAVVPIAIEMIVVPTFPHVIGKLGYVPISALRSLQMKRLTWFNARVTIQSFRLPETTKNRLRPPLLMIMVLRCLVQRWMFHLEIPQVPQIRYRFHLPVPLPFRHLAVPSFA